jgi:2-polyprenyl-6-hydroxyphenyl methylase / 3-demethylubiquinone-9 3-methyltransferase
MMTALRINDADKAEIAKFSKLAKAWWNPFGSSKPLHDINPLRIDFIRKYAVLSSKHILDIGCGGGILTESLAKLGGIVTGIDLSVEVIDIAKHHASDQGLTIDYQVISAKEYADTFPHKFDIVTCMELLEHVADPLSLIASCANLLKPDGHLFLSTLNRNLKSYLYAILGAEYFLKLLPKGTHHYEKFIRPSELFAMLSHARLQLIHMAGICYHPIFRIYQLTSDVSINYLVHSQPFLLDFAIDM